VELAVLLLSILFFCARCLTRIYDLRMGAEQDIKSAQGMQQWWRWRKQGTGKQWNSPISPLYSFLTKEPGLRRGVRSESGSPLTERKITKLPRCPCNGQRLVNMTYREILLLMSRAVLRLKITRQIWLLKNIGYNVLWMKGVRLQQ
jgi:hypothetical protein